MKKMIALALCVANVACFGMNQKVTKQQRQTKALEFLVTSHALQTCMQMKKYNYKHTPIKDYDSYNMDCSTLIRNFKELAENNSM